MSNDGIIVREANEGDVSFIFATALRNTWYSNQLETTLPKAKWMQLKHFEIERQLDSYPTLVATLASDLDIILGYAIVSPTPYVYIKKAWRNTGVEHLLNTEIRKLTLKQETSQ